MIDYEMALQADELLYGDYEKMSLISAIMFRKFLRQFKTKTVLPRNKVWTLSVAKKTYWPVWIWHANFQCFFFYWQHFISLEPA